jgi:plasmid stability protein
MKNVTITLPEDVARWARIWAARHETSVSRLLGEMLRERMLLEDEYERAQERYLSIRPVRLKKKGSYPRREALHERKGLRGHERPRVRQGRQ